MTSNEVGWAPGTGIGVGRTGGTGAFRLDADADTFELVAVLTSPAPALGA